MLSESVRTCHHVSVEEDMRHLRHKMIEDVPLQNLKTFFCLECLAACRAVAKDREKDAAIVADSQ